MRAMRQGGVAGDLDVFVELERGACATPDEHEREDHAGQTVHAEMTAQDPVLRTGTCFAELRRLLWAHPRAGPSRLRQWMIESRTSGLATGAPSGRVRFGQLEGFDDPIAEGEPELAHEQGTVHHQRVKRAFRAIMVTIALC